MGPKYESLECLQIQRREHVPAYETRSERINMHTKLKRQLVEHNIFVVTETLLLSCPETCEMPFTGWSILWSTDSLNRQLLPIRTSLGPAGSAN